MVNEKPSNKIAHLYNWKRHRHTHTHGKYSMRKRLCEAKTFAFTNYNKIRLNWKRELNIKNKKKIDAWKTTECYKYLQKPHHVKIYINRNNNNNNKYKTKIIRIDALLVSIHLLDRRFSFISLVLFSFFFVLFLSWKQWLELNKNNSICSSTYLKPKERTKSPTIKQ